MDYTITEGLAEIKTINARLVKKRQSVIEHLARFSHIMDPFLQNDGNQRDFVSRERQAIKDLEERILTIRSAIQVKNQTTPLKIGNTNRSLQEWLNWRRDISANQSILLQQMNNKIQTARSQLKSGQSISEEAVNKPNVLIVNINEQSLISEIEEMEEILGTLDGKLSLLNATLKITY